MPFPPRPPGAETSAAEFALHGVGLSLAAVAPKLSGPGGTAESRREAAEYTHQPSAISNRPQSFVIWIEEAAEIPAWVWESLDG